MNKADTILRIAHFSLSFSQQHTSVQAVDDISFSLSRGQRLAIVGESGSGKTVSCLSILNLFDESPIAHSSGQILYEERNLLDTNAPLINKIRGNKIALISQEPMSAMNPITKCGKQLSEMLRLHSNRPINTHKNHILQLLEQVQLSDPERIYQSYSHELSGGQLQRVQIAMALSTDPEIIICDEPTTALDVTIQQEILTLLAELTDMEDTSLLFISHDLSVVTQLCDSVIVMHEGRIVERGPLPETFSHPQHAYTRALLQSRPTIKNQNKVLPTVTEIISGQYQERPRPVRQLGEEPILTVKSLTKTFDKKNHLFSRSSQTVVATDDVSFELRRGEVLGIVGESGSGKSTIARCIAGLYEYEGQISYLGKAVNPKSYQADLELRQKVQMVFQDPYSSLNPKMKIGPSLVEIIRQHQKVSKSVAKSKAIEWLHSVGLDETYYDRYPDGLSGGQRQRVCIAKCLCTQPEILICDEAVSALDVSVQALILNLLDQLIYELGLTILFISHDISVVRYISDRVLVMKEGQIVESGETHSVLDSPQNAYTQRLVDAVI